MLNDIFTIILLLAALCMIAWTLFTRRLKSMSIPVAIFCGIIVFLILASFIKFSFFQMDQLVENMLGGF